ncbi:sigma-70 family RNA polymerase sigma factor [Steroidobacter sp.]|uniref:sigma-70 family RNA polymerase sigma factor n=1 Tax=Steroidobacter sp. TaxID=1978227 RepID=UPI001A5C9910|nr:sigma-70 family RNA polymerase sigma factor [Steroidobacter sp.]MBL8265627.1 sigma-70 family RNA polymerase sigma factor [Steroidobacter sp.]
MKAPIPSNPAVGEPDSASEAAEAARAAEIARLFKEHNRTLVMFLAARLKNAQLAKEVAQEAYVKVLQLEKPGAISFLRSYLFRTAANLAIDRLRQERARKRLDQRDSFEDFIQEPLAERAAAAHEELDSLLRFVDELPARYGEAFRLYGLKENSFDEVAAALGVKPRMARHYVTLSLIYIRLRREGVAADQAWSRLHEE